MGDGGSYAMVAPWMENGNIVEFLEENPGADPLKLARTDVHFMYTPLSPATARGRDTRSSVPPSHGARPRRPERSTTRAHILGIFERRR